MESIGSYEYDSDRDYGFFEGETSEDMFFLGTPKNNWLYREADCELKEKKVTYKEANCELNKVEEDKDSNRMIKTKDNQYVSCTLIKGRKKEITLERILNSRESSIRADYEWENKINQNIELRMQEEEQSLIYNALIAIICSALYMLFFVVTEGEYSYLISVILTIALITAVLNLAGTVIIYMINNDFKATRGIAEVFGLEPMILQKSYSDRKIFMIEAELSKVKIVKRMKLNQ